MGVENCIEAEVGFGYEVFHLKALKECADLLLFEGLRIGKNRILIKNRMES